MDIAVIGGGISGLATAYEIDQELRDRDGVVSIFEASNRLGGKIDTRQIEGYTIEGGVNGWLDSKPATDELCRQLQIYEQRLISNDAARRRFIWYENKLHPVPETPLTFLKSQLLRWRGKARVLFEPWARSSTAEDESIAEFAQRRLGQEVLDKLLDPMVSGIYAGDPYTLSLRSCFPRIAELEATYGSLIRAQHQLKKQRQRQTTPGASARASAAGPGGRLISFPQGTIRLIHEITNHLHEIPKLNHSLIRLQFRGKKFRLFFSNDVETEADIVVLAIPAYAAALVCQELDEKLKILMKNIPYSSVSIVALAWQKKHITRDTQAFGFLVPYCVHSDILGTLWDSSVFSSRAPNKFMLTRTIVGGSRHPELSMQSDDVMIAKVKATLAVILGTDAEPVIKQVIRHEKAIPQYTLGHADRLEKIDNCLKAFPGVFLTGNAYRGVALNDCAANAKKIAKEVKQFIQKRGLVMAEKNNQK